MDCAQFYSKTSLIERLFYYFYPKKVPELINKAMLLVDVCTSSSKYFLQFYESEPWSQTFKT